MNEAGVFLDAGSKPHAIPFSRAQQYAKYYGMDPKVFWAVINKRGTKRKPFINKSFDFVWRKRHDIYQDVLEKIGLW